MRSDNKTVLAAGSSYDDIFGTVSVECDKQFDLFFISEKDNQVICIDDDGVEWNKKFLHCQSLFIVCLNNIIVSLIVNYFCF